jgi:predicted nucleotidyltransferase
MHQHETTSTEHATNQMLDDMVQLIVSEIEPQQIVLFGSMARGDAGPDSDVDLLIVEAQPFDKQHGRRRELARLWRLLSRFPVSKDIVLYSRAEVDRWRNSTNHLIARALREGRVLYERR